MIKGFLNDIRVNESFMASIFSNMMDDRDRFEPEEWVRRYHDFLLVIVNKLIEVRDIKMSEDDKITYLAKMSHAIYTKEFDSSITDMGFPGEA